jgi:hypothetical protein
MLINKVVEALETDISWLEAYGLSGELNVPGDFDGSGELTEPLINLKEVCYSSLPVPCFNQLLGFERTQAQLSSEWLMA